MKDDLRTLLHALADRLTSSLEAAPTTDVPASASATEERRMLAQALAAVADGDVSLGVANGVRATPEGESLGEALRRIRELVTAARDVVATGTDGVEDVRAAAERAADGTSRQRLGIDRILEQLRQVIQRAGGASPPRPWKSGSTPIAPPFSRSTPASRAARRRRSRAHARIAG